MKMNIFLIKIDFWVNLMHLYIIFNQEDKIISMYKKNFINEISAFYSMNCSINQFNELLKLNYIFINIVWLTMSSFICFKEVCFHHKMYSDWINVFYLNNNKSLTIFATLLCKLKVLIIDKYVVWIYSLARYDLWKTNNSQFKKKLLC